MPVVAALGAVWIMIALLCIALDMTFWIAVVMAAFTLPALWDVIRDSQSSIEVWPNRITWNAAFSDGDVSDINEVRLNRRFDGSMKVILVHIGGKTTRLPPDIAPPVAAFEAALDEAGIAHQRHPFLPF